MINNLFKKLLPIVVFVLFLTIFADKAHATDSVCTDLYPGNPDKACCTQWGPPDLAVCTNNENICLKCGSCGPKICPFDIGYGNTPGSYCKFQCLDCGVTSDWVFDNDCNCVKTWEGPTDSISCQGPAFCPATNPPTKPPTNPPTKPPTSVPTTPPGQPSNTPKPTNPPQTCPDSYCAPNETCSSCPQDCGPCAPTNPPVTRGPSNTPGPTNTPKPTSTPGPTNTPKPPATSTPKPPTPTPDFNNDMCKCDSISVTALKSGQPFTATGRAKVVGTDRSKARPTGIRFQLFEGNQRLTQTGFLPVVLAGQTANQDNYTSTWNYTMPSNIKRGVDYKIQAQIRCAPKTTAMGGTSAVLGESTNALGSYFGSALGFVKDIAYKIYSLPFGGSRIASEDSLQLATFTPLEITENSCSFIKFRAE